MCFSQYGTYAPRPVREEPVRPEGAAPTPAELDAKLYGPRPTPPAWEPEHSRTHNGSNELAQPVSGTQAAVVVAAFGVAQTREATIVELADGSRLLICPI